MSSRPRPLCPVVSRARRGSEPDKCNMSYVSFAKCRVDADQGTYSRMGDFKQRKDGGSVVRDRNVSNIID